MVVRNPSLVETVARLRDDVKVLKQRVGRHSNVIDLPVLATDPPAPAAGARLYAVVSAGKTQLRVRFPTGAVQTLSTEP